MSSIDYETDTNNYFRRFWDDFIKMIKGYDILKLVMIPDQCW